MPVNAITGAALGIPWCFFPPYLYVIIRLTSALFFSGCTNLKLIFINITGCSGSRWGKLPTLPFSATHTATKPTPKFRVIGYDEVGKKKIKMLHLQYFPIEYCEHCSYAVSMHFQPEVVQCSVHTFYNEPAQFIVHDSTFWTTFVIPKNEQMSFFFLLLLFVKIIDGAHMEP